METFKAEVVHEGENYFLALNVRSNEIKIPLTEDKPNDIMSAFNDLIVELKKGEFQFELHNHEHDLYTQISKEYIHQLNEELSSVYNELSDYELLEAD